MKKQQALYETQLAELVSKAELITFIRSLYVLSGTFIVLVAKFPLLLELCCVSKFA